MVFTQWRTLNNAACDLAREVADEGGALVAGGLSPVPAFSEGKGKEFVQNEFKQQCDLFVNKRVDFLLGEVRFHFLAFVHVDLFCYPLCSLLFLS